jgi:hypothetical protein
MFLSYVYGLLLCLGSMWFVEYIHVLMRFQFGPLGFVDDVNIEIGGLIA